ncbi:NAD dependent epimerase/dehydratase [Diaporthe helianthi]|uniref:NAD dependent epimerase/dehydratase n=1 Tax=Diaporthe helianthi TaxID=158607 RepID=A0A2P5HFB6_DIAHE|nr:NAD dependent epimerase/dehydratase [Diaporthe helianthi]
MSRPLIFITGATGFIGCHVVLQSLEAGYKVRLSVRKEGQISALRKLFSKHAANLDFVVIQDFTNPSRFSEALQDVTYVIHLASPMPGKGTDFKSDYLQPAAQGTIALLDAAKKIKSIKRVIVVSSVLALIPLDGLATGKFTVKEGINHTIPVDPDMAFPEDPMASGGMMYQVSKILAHRATLDWVRTNKPSFGLVTLHPSFVFGRNLSQTSTEGLDGTNAMLWGCLHSPKAFIPANGVDVRDVALAHLKALETEAVAEGEVAEFVRAKYPALDVKLEGPFEEPPVVITQKAETVLGMKWKSMEETVGSFLDQQLQFKAQL